MCVSLECVTLAALCVYAPVCDPSHCYLHLSNFATCGLVRDPLVPGDPLLDITGCRNHPSPSHTGRWGSKQPSGLLPNIGSDEWGRSAEPNPTFPDKPLRKTTCKSLASYYRGRDHYVFPGLDLPQEVLSSSSLHGTGDPAPRRR